MVLAPALVAMLASAVLPQLVYADPDTETLRPNSAGDDTGISSQYPASGAHWDKVDEATADDLSTYIYTTVTNYQRDLYNLPDHTGSGTINSVTLYFRFAHRAARIYAVAYTDFNSHGILKTVKIAANGKIAETVIDTLEFDAAEGLSPNIIHISGDVYAIAYTGNGDDGFLKTVQISNNGQINDTVIDILEFDGSAGNDPNIIHVSGNVYAIAYKGKGDDGFLTTVEIGFNGQITDAVVDVLEFDPVVASEPNIIPVSGNVYAIAYRGNAGHGFLKTVEIAANGQITDTEIDSFEFDTVMGYYPNIIHIWGDVYAIAYAGIFEYGYLKTVEIAANGQITDTAIDTLEFDGVLGSTPNIISVSGDVYAIAYKGGSSDGFLKTVNIAANGQITDTVIDSLEFDALEGLNPNIIPVSGNVYAIAYKGVLLYYVDGNPVAEPAGIVKTMEIAADGQIADMPIDTLKFGAGAVTNPNIIPLTYIPGDVYARAAVETHDTVYTGTEESTSSDTFVTCSYQWTLNPKTGSAWTWDEIDSLQIGVELKTDDASDSAACTQVWVVIDFASTLSVLVSDSTFAFGTNPLDAWLTPETSVITNDGGVAENFVGSISQFTDGASTWEMSTSANGTDTIRAQWSIISETGPWADISAYDTDFTIATNVAVNDSVTFWFRIQTPIMTSSYNQHSSTLTVTAQQY
jgi:hypothetical protein